MPILESDRLLLRPIQLDDGVDMYAYASDTETLKFLEWDAHKNIEQSYESIKNHFLSRLDRGLPEAYAIVIKEDSRMIGTIDVHTLIHDDVGEIGYVIHKDYWSKGIVTEALQMLIPTLFHHCGFYRVEISHIVDNIASQRVIEKAGFIKEGCFRKRKKEKNGLRSDYLHYGLLKDDEVVQERYSKKTYEKYT